MTKLTWEVVLDRFYQTHGDKYDYSQSVYTGCDNKIAILCEDHGIFHQSPFCHWKGQGCPRCGRIKANHKLKSKNRAIELTTEFKTCVKCGDLKHKSMFFVEKKLLHGVESKCKVCHMKHKTILRILRTGLPMYQSHKSCIDCGDCFHISEFKPGKVRIYARCKTCRLLKGKRYRENNPEETRRSGDLYYQENREDILVKSKQHREARAFSSTYLSQLTVDEKPRDENGYLSVVCKNCGIRFFPTNTQCKSRTQCLKSTVLGEGHLYCSEQCKESCDIFNRVTLRKSEQPDRRARGCQISTRNALLESQCDEVGYNYCEKCGDIIDVELHHTLEVQNGDGAISSAGHILLCLGCHRDLHLECK